MYIECNTVNLAIVAAALGEADDFEATLNILLEDIGRNVQWALTHNAHWSRLASF